MSDGEPKPCGCVSYYLCPAHAVHTKPKTSTKGKCKATRMTPPDDQTPITRFLGSR